jgi:hypothetical protein
MFNRHSPGRSIRSDSASAARVLASPVGLLGRLARRGEPGRLGAVRFNSGGAVMTADRVGHGSRRPMRPVECGEAAFIEFDALDLLSAEAFTSTDCPEARMAGGNHHHHHNNNQVR